MLGVWILLWDFMKEITVQGLYLTLVIYIWVKEYFFQKFPIKEKVIYIQDKSIIRNRLLLSTETASNLKGL